VGVIQESATQQHQEIVKNEMSLLNLAKILQFPHQQPIGIAMSISLSVILASRAMFIGEI
jgi:hypothetical protein